MRDNPTLKQRKAPKETSGRSQNGSSSRRYTSRTGRNGSGSANVNANAVNKGGLPAWTWMILGALLLAGFVYVDHMTHESLHRKAQSLNNGSGPAELNNFNRLLDKFTNGNANGNGSGGTNKANGNGGINNSQDNKSKADVHAESAQEVAMHALKSSIYEDTSLIGADGRRSHLIFSTDCSEFQHWQSYLMFHSALKVNQPGSVTRIASGCSDEEAISIRKWHREHITKKMGGRFFLHLTPHFSNVKDADGQTIGDYKFFNKPFGLLHWLEHGIGFDNGDSSGPLKNEDDVVILIDPDMVLLRPITGDFSKERDVVIGKRHLENRRFKVEHGSPFAQKYGFGSQWRTFNLHDIAGADSPAKLVSQKDGGSFYPVGPPYLGTVRDMHSIAEKWTEFVPRVHKEYPYLLAEMFAFCIAAAHLELPHQIVDSLMISNTNGDGPGGEGWPMLDAIPAGELCDFAKKPDHEKYAIPSVIHYCQRYAIQEWFFGKRKMDKQFFTCDSPLMEEPPSDIVPSSDWKMPPGGTRKDLTPIVAKKEGFMVCGVIGALNDAATFYKKHHCPEGEGNMSKTLNLATKK
mmetsp:Transcript_20415/g.30987  ORF Transcript_20415/g.30987 Transcript_20415/m.30987 type:complete len:576 (+) Transcript_20415:255-1982(+)